MKVRVLLNTNPMRMTPIAVPPAKGEGAQAGDTFTEAHPRFEPLAHFDDDDNMQPCEHVEHWLLHLWELGNSDESRAQWGTKTRSLSIGDVVVIGEAAYAVLMIGWAYISPDVFDTFTVLDDDED